MNIGIYVYQDAEVLDFSGPFEVFTTATRVHARQHPSESPLFEVFLIATGKGLVTARAGFSVMPHFTIEDHPPLDILIVPGGIHTVELSNQAGIQWMAGTRSRWIASVCTGAFLLAQAGILSDQECTTHWEDISDLRAMFPRLQVKEDVPWVDNGHIITSAGISAGIEMSLHLIAKIFGEDLARKTARQMQYTWNSMDRSLESP